MNSHTSALAILSLITTELMSSTDGHAESEPGHRAKTDEEARERGISTDALLKDVVSKQVRVAGASPTTKGEAHELPIRHLGVVGSLHRRDIYDDVG